MNLEQRVQALEQELQILKGQIQTILLDIREQLLNDTYPGLRAEGVSSSQVPQPVSPATPAPIRHVALNGATTTPLTPETDEPAAIHDSPAPVVRQVRLEDLQPPEPVYNAPARPLNTETAPNRTPMGCPDDTIHTRPVRRVSVDEIRGELPDELDLSDTRPTPPFLVDDDAPPFIMQTELLTDADWASLEMLEEWVERKVKDFGQRRARELVKAYAAMGRFDNKMREALLQLVSIIGEDREVTTPTAAPTAKKVEPPSNTAEDQSRKLIMKLIAGVQDVGNGTGRKKHG